LVLLVQGIYVNVFPQSYDTKYTVEYTLKDINGNMINKIKLFRNGAKMKFSKVENKGTDKETTTDIYIFKDESMVYTVVSNSAGKFGSKHALDLSLVGMQTGVYILDLGNDGKIFNSSSRAGTGTVLGYDCVKYTIASTAEASSDYYMYQDNLMLKRFVGSYTEGNTIEALSFDNTTDVPESMFVVPAETVY